jgi:hypothetical protein
LLTTKGVEAILLKIKIMMIFHDVAIVNLLKGSITLLETQSKEAKAKQIVFVITTADSINTIYFNIRSQRKGFLYVFIILDK